MGLTSEILLSYKNVLGKAHRPYANHAERVYRIAILMDKNNVVHPNKLAIACAFHDIGIWVDEAWDYLAPSEQLCENYLKENGRVGWTEEILLMINQHHKLLPYKGKPQYSVELFRKADLVDFSAGITAFSIRRHFYRNLILEFPLLGFHGHLAKSFWQHFKSKPWNPFPMVKM